MNIQMCSEKSEKEGILLEKVELEGKVISKSLESG